jgi:hypothetical protein
MRGALCLLWLLAGPAVASAQKPLGTAPFVYARRYGAGGRPVTGPIAVTRAPGAENQQGVAMMADGSFVVAYTDRGQGEDSVLKARWYSPAGAPWGEAVVARGGRVRGNLGQRPAASIPGRRLRAPVPAEIGRLVMIRTLRFVLLLLLAAPAPLLAQTPIGGDILVSHARQLQGDPHVAVGARGDFVVSWLRETSHGSSLYARRYAASGAPASGEILVAGLSASSSGVAIARDGSFVVVFTYGSAGALSLRARWYAPNGALRGTLVVASSVWQPQTAVASRGDGGFAVLYQTAAGLAVRAFGPDRAPLGAPSVIDPGIFIMPFALAMGPDGELTAAWQEVVQSSLTDFHYHVRARHLAADGAPLAASFLVVPEEVVLEGIHAGGDQDGNLLFLWTSEGERGLFLRPFTADGAPLGAAVQPVDVDPIGTFDVAVDADRGAGFVAAWLGEEETSIQSHIYVRRFTADGLPLGPLRQANGYAAPVQYAPVVAAGPGGSFVVAWVSGSRAQTTDILVRRFRR